MAKGDEQRDPFPVTSVELINHDETRHVLGLNNDGVLQYNGMRMNTVLDLDRLNIIRTLLSSPDSFVPIEAISMPTVSPGESELLIKSKTRQYMAGLEISRMFLGHLTQVNLTDSTEPCEGWLFTRHQIIAWDADSPRVSTHCRTDRTEVVCELDAIGLPPDILPPADHEL